MKLRPTRNAGISVSLSKKFYQRSTIQNQQQIQKLQKQNLVKKEMIQRMNAQLENLKNYLDQQCYSVNNPNSTVKKSSPLTKGFKSPNKNIKSNKSISKKINQQTLSSPTDKGAPKEFARSQSACKHSRKRTTNRLSLMSKKTNIANSRLQDATTCKNQPAQIKSLEQLKISSHKKDCFNKANKDQNYIKYLQTRLKQLAKEVKLHNQAQLKIQKKQYTNSRRH